MAYLYYVIIFLAVVMMGWEAYVIFVRNKTIKIKGSDDPFVLMIAMGLSMLLLAPQTEAVLATAIASICVLAAELFTIPIKRGLSDKGFQKLFYRIAWEDVREAALEKVGMSRIKLYVGTDGGKRSLLFLIRDMKDVVRLIQAHGIRVRLDKDLSLK